jgi:hypothetical protein
MDYTDTDSLSFDLVLHSRGSRAILMLALMWYSEQRILGQSAMCSPEWHASACSSGGQGQIIQVIWL